MINKIPKRWFYNGTDYELDYVNKKLILKPEFHEKLLNKKLWNKFGFKKIGGSLVGEVLEVDSFKTQFGAFCKIAWCGLPVLDDKYVKAGVAIEPKVINVLEKVLMTSITVYPVEQYNYDYFADKDEIIGGIPDGFIERDQIIIEIKTTGEKNYDNWNSFGVPAGYLKQAQIYSYLMGVEKFWIVAAFLKENDYLNPKDYPIEKRIIKNYKFVINKEQVHDDINKMKKWYIDHTTSGISPIWDEIKDSDQLEFLKCKNQDEYIELLEKWKKEGKFVDK